MRGYTNRSSWCTCCPSLHNSGSRSDGHSVHLHEPFTVFTMTYYEGRDSPVKNVLDIITVLLLPGSYIQPKYHTIMSFNVQSSWNYFLYTCVSWEVWHVTFICTNRNLRYSYAKWVLIWTDAIAKQYCTIVLSTNLVTKIVRTAWTSRDINQDPLVLKSPALSPCRNTVCSGVWHFLFSFVLYCFTISGFVKPIKYVFYSSF